MRTLFNNYLIYLVIIFIFKYFMTILVILVLSAACKSGWRAHFAANPLSLSNDSGAKNTTFHSS